MMSEHMDSMPKTPNGWSGSCFYCKKEGHWYRDCPQRSGGKQPLPRNTKLASDDACDVPHSSPTRNMMSERMDSMAKTPNGRSGSCFYCKKEGHWYRDCPQRSGGKQPLPRNTELASDDACDVPVLHCPRGCGPCVAYTSRSVENLGRKYYRCLVPNDAGTKMCGFFKWCDMVAMSLQRGHTVATEDPPNPNCPCGAGWCLRKTMDTGEHAGRKYFACPSKTEICNFLKWCDVDSILPQNGTSSINQKKRGLSEPSPMCPCGAGKCRPYVIEHGEESVHMYFACPILKGQGACNFIQWLDLGNVDSTDGSHVQETQHPTIRSTDGNHVQEIHHPAIRGMGQPSSMMNGGPFSSGLNEDLSAVRISGEELAADGFNQREVWK